MSQRTKIKALLQSQETGIDVTVKGWVRAFRSNRFIALNDGSTNSNLQVVVDFEKEDPAVLKRITVGAAVAITGKLVPSLGQGQSVEVTAETIEILGDSDPEKYPLQPKKHSLEFLREIAHLRFRTSTFGAIFRVRNTLAFAVHQFFQEKGFVYLHTPVITASDAEGAGETFHVTNFDLGKVPLKSEKFEAAKELYFNKLITFVKEHNLLNEYKEIDSILKALNPEMLGLEVSKIDFKGLIVADEHTLDILADNFELVRLSPLIKKFYLSVKRNGFWGVPNAKDGVYLPNWLLESVNKNISKYKLTREYTLSDYPHLGFCFYNIRFVRKELRVSKSSHVDYTQDFFGRATNLTVSGQLEGELGAMALSDIYTFGPTFRAENSNTTRHLAEFWMIEPEMAFYDLHDNMDLAEGLLKYVIKVALEKNSEDLEFLNQRLADEEKQKPQNERSELSLLDKLQFCLDNDFERLTYTEAIEILRESTPNKKKKFQYRVEGWGTDLQSEHERYLVEKHFKKPVILTDYPKEIKAFYMRQNEPDAQGRETVRAMDILFPGIGEIVGGSQREERLDRLEKRMDEMGIPKEELWWYLDTRRFGACPHAGFGLGFERLVLFVTGMGNIRDVIPFPRFPKNAEF
ncbi:asparagine--tRNA ligase [Mucilaginibacter terrenus]|uniref:asparagine--tRNA ligase n=1 Tax=Mucilaginibacter terrenus TaxID=2482727 RepID=UPI001F1F0A11|nr:asparagine--tRNA ligase [Mucilaginibacter terrenus]